MDLQERVATISASLYLITKLSTCNEIFQDIFVNKDGIQGEVKEGVEGVEYKAGGELISLLRELRLVWDGVRDTGMEEYNIRGRL